MQKQTALALAALLFTVSAQAMELRFLADLNIPVGGQFRDTVIGGLSALSCDPASGRLIALSDDRGNINPARYYDMQLAFGPHSLSVTPTAVTFLKTPDGTNYPAGSIDPEGIARAGSRTFFSSEGDQRTKPRIAPAVFEIDSTGKTIGQLPIPAKFVPEATGDQTRGILDNKGFESLTIFDGKLYTASELALFQDDSMPTFEKGAVLRILEFAGLNGPLGDARTREFAYPIDAVKRSNPEEKFGDQGLSDMMSLGDGGFLAIERGGTILGGKWRTQVKIYEFSLDGATDVSALPSLKGATYTPVKKQLVIDLDSVLPRLSPGFQSIDNIEGLCRGPVSPNGLPTLVLVADDNFNEGEQRTQFLAFEILHN